MTNILDSVKPDVYECGYWGAPYYSRESVESIIKAVKAETRKEVLLEAAGIVGDVYARCKETEKAHYRLSSKTFLMANFSFNPYVVAYSHDKADELRRMAESDKGGDENGAY